MRILGKRVIWKEIPALERAKGWVWIQLAEGEKICRKKAERNKMRKKNPWNDHSTLEDIVGKSGLEQKKRNRKKEDIS